jgi:DNA-directed RNA polymerase subunit L/DNA-directed RNA polymerase alpha subunit
MMSKISNLKEEDGIMYFTISNIYVSYVNAIRRTILSDIPIVVFRTTPYEENKANIIINTSRLNNEIIKQRLSCIPICISDINDVSIQTYLLELDVENKTDTSIIVTTNDFKIRDTNTNKYLEDGEVKKIFPPYIPPNGNGEYYIDFLRLRPKISDEIPGEKIKLTCQFSVGNAREDAMFNITGTCSYGCTPDQEKIEEQLAIRKQKWKDEEKTESEIKFEAANWKLLEAMRYIIKNSFDFVIESVGIYDNERIIIESCIILLNKLDNLKRTIEQDEIEIKPSDNTLENCYDITLVNEDYTIGNILNYELYKVFYTELKVINYVGFKKFHPHDSDSMLRISLIEKEKGISTIKTMLISVINESIKILQDVKGCFDGTRTNC